MSLLRPKRQDVMLAVRMHAMNGSTHSQRATPQAMIQTPTCAHLPCPTIVPLCLPCPALHSALSHWVWHQLQGATDTPHSLQ